MARALKFIVLIAIVAALAGTGWYLWDTGRIPGNPAAPTKKIFDALIAEYLKTEDGRQYLDYTCLPLPLAYRFEERGHPGVFFNYAPPAFRIAMRDTATPERARQAAQLSALAKVGYFREEEETLANGGTARVFLMDWKIRDVVPWGDGANCIQAPRSEFHGVKDWNDYTRRVAAVKAGKGEQPPVPIDNAVNALEAASAAEGGLTVYEVWFETGPARLTTELRELLATGLFDEWKPLRAPKRRPVYLVRKFTGWRFAETVGQDPQAESVKAGRRAALLKARAGMNEEKATELLVGHLAKWTPEKLDLCLALPGSSNTREVVAQYNAPYVDENMNYSVTYYRLSAMPGVTTGNHFTLMKLLGELGIFEVTVPKVAEYKGSAVLRAARYTLKAEYKAWRNKPASSPCMVAAKLRLEVTRIADDYISDQFRYWGRATVEELHPWAKKVALQKLYAPLRLVVREGLPFMGELAWDPQQGWKAGLFQLTMLPAVPAGTDADEYEKLPAVSQ
jgi:hypothetical protein